MSDTDAIFRLLKREGSRGVHTLDLRRKGYSGNPSQRKADIEKKYGVEIHAESERRDGRNGSRYTLIGESDGHTTAVSKTEGVGAHSRLSGSSLDSGVGHRAGGRGEPRRPSGVGRTTCEAADAASSSVSGAQAAGGAFPGAHTSRPQSAPEPVQLFGGYEIQEAA